LTVSQLSRFFKNPNFLTNIRRSNSQLKVHTNGGTQILSLVGDIKNFGTVWYNPDSLANIFSLAAVCKLCRIMIWTRLLKLPSASIVLMAQS
jgi:hypothetical protein